MKKHWNALHHTALALILVCLMACGSQPVSAWQPDLPGLQLNAALIEAAWQPEHLANNNAQPFSDEDLNTLLVLRAPGFIENHGQFDERVRFAVLAGDQALWVAADSLWLTYGAQSGTPLSIQLRFVDTNPTLEFSGQEPLPGEALTVWGAVRGVEIYPGMDLEIRARDGELDYRWIANGVSGLPAAARVEVLAGKPPLLVDSLPLGDSAPAAQLVTALGEFPLPVFALAGEDSPNTTRVSVASNGTQGNHDSGIPAISTDGRFVTFSSAADNLVAGDTNGVPDIFVRDRQTGQTVRVSVASDGTQANNTSYGYSSISADGRFVVFPSYANNLVIGDTNGASDIFLHDRQTGQTSRVSIANDGTQGNNASAVASISANGRLVVFISTADNLVPGDTNMWSDIFVHDRQTGQTTRISVASDGSEGNSASYSPSISADGRFVTFTSAANNLVSGDTNMFEDIFVHDRQTGQTTRVSVASDGTPGDYKSQNSSISANGRFVAFFSEASNLVSDDTNRCGDAFVYDRQTGQTTRVSIASDGTQGVSVSGDTSISADGRFVTFGSAASNLVPEDTNNSADVFMHDRQTGLTTRVSVSSNGTQGNNSCGWNAISADGRFVAFESLSDNLVPSDTNESLDIFVRDLMAGSTPSEEIDLGFRPNPDGFAFQNFGGNNMFEFTIFDVRDMFGDEAVCTVPEPFCWPRRAATEWQQQAKEYLALGHCEGMAVTSLRLFVPDYESPQDFDSQANHTHDLWLWLDMRRYIANYFVRQLVYPVLGYKSRSVGNTPAQVLEQLSAALSNETTDPPILFIFKSYEEGGGHTITPYKIREVEEGVFHISVYDNNYPDDATRYVTVNTSLNTWSYDLGSGLGELSGDANSHNFGVVPISEYEKAPVCPWCEGNYQAAGDNMVTTWMQGAGSLLVENTLGQRMGYQDGQLYEEIEGGYLAVISTDGTSSLPPQYVLPAGDAYQYNLSGAGLSTAGEASITQFGPGFAVSVEQIPVSADTADQMEISADGTDVSYRAVNAAAEIDLQLIAETETRSRQVRITGVDVGAGEQLYVQAPAGSQTVKLDGSLAAGGVYDFKLDESSPSGASHFLHSQIALDASDTHYFTVGASSSMNQLTLEVDHGSDGGVDEVKTLKNQYWNRPVQLRTKSLVFKKDIPTLRLSGSTASPCHTLQVDVAEADENGNIAVAVYSVLNPNRVCAQVVRPFERQVPLRDLPSGSYTVSVNGKQIAAFDRP